MRAPARMDHRRDSLSWDERMEGWRRAFAETDWTPWLIVALAAFLRIFLLGIKPPHFDEGINGWFVDQMTKNGFYKYDPTNYHGPLHFYILFLAQTLFGRSVWVLRMPVVLGSIAAVWLTLKFEPFVGRTAARLAALAMAVSPGFVFYGRYSIHEVWMLLFSMLFILGCLGLWRIGSARYLWCAGMGICGMILTKETYIIHLGCALAAFFVAWISQKITPAEDAAPAEQTWTYASLGAVVAVGLAAIAFFYSGTFLNWSGLKGLYETFGAWFKTGSNGNGHEKAWWYWLMLLGRYEPPIALALAGCLLCQMFKSISVRYLAIYGAGTLAAYSIVAYKTPWCIISIVWPLLFVFGALPGVAPLKFRLWQYAAWAGLLLVLIGCAVWATVSKKFEYFWPYLFIVFAAGLFSTIRSRRVTYAVVIIFVAISLGLSIRLNYFRCTTETEPYVYVQTYNDIYKLTDPLLTLAKRNPIYYQLVGHMIRTSAYPLPWILGDFTRVGYYENDNLPTPLDADFLVVQEDKIETVESKLQGTYYTMPFTIRPYQDTSKLYLSAKVFKDFFKGKVPDFTGHASATITPH